MKYFLPGNLDYESGLNGDYNLQPLNGTFHSGQINEIPYIEFELDRDEYGLWTNVVRDGVVVSDVPYGDYEDWFRIWSIDKDSKEDSITVTARHIFYDLVSTVAKDFNNDDVCIVATGLCNGQQALEKLLKNTKFTAHSNILKTDSVRWERKYITEALLSDDDNSFVNRWGGELYVHKYHVYMNTSIGSDKGVRITYGKNIDQISENVDMSNLVTRIIPTGYDGLRLTGRTPWVDSQNISNYATIHDSVVKFDKVKVGTDEGDFATEELARAELKRLSNLMFTNDKVDTPTINIKIDMIELSTTDEYKNYSCLEEVWQGDTVYCNHDKLNIDTKARCISYTWDIVNKEKLDNEIGDVTESYFDKQNNLTSTLQQIVKDGRIDASYIQGIINSFNTVLKAQYSVAQKQHVRAILFEDLDPDSSTFGALCLGTQGWQISKERTSDGKDWVWSTAATGSGIVADMILVGTLTAITIQNADASFKIDLGKTGGCNFYSYGDLALDINGSALSFYNFLKNNVKTGELSTKVSIDSQGKFIENEPFIDLSHENNAMLRFSYRGNSKRNSKEKDNAFYPYMEFDIESIRKETNKTPVTFYENLGFVNYSGIYMYGNDHLYPTAFVGMNTNNDMSLMCGKDFNLKLGYMEDKQASSFMNMVVINKDGFQAYGDKNCIQVLTDYGDVKFSSIEDIGAYLTWREYDAFKEQCIYETKKSKYSKDENYSCIVKIPWLIQECIDTEGQYNVEISVIRSFANARLWAINKEYFLVKSNKPCRFNFVLVGRRRGFEARSLEEQIIDALKFKTEKNKEDNRMIQVKARTRRYFKINNLKRDYRLWAKCGEEWEEFGRCIDD